MRIVSILIIVLSAVTAAQAQHGPEAAYAQLMELTKVFTGTAPFACKAIVEVKYKTNAAKPIRDTSTLIYRGGETYYRSGRVEHVEGAEGALFVNHELKAVQFRLSDSMREALRREMNIQPDPELVKLAEPANPAADLARAKAFFTQQCTVSWETVDGVEEIRFTPKSPASSTTIGVKIRFDGSRIQHYEYSYRDIYAKDYYGASQFRVIRTVYQDFVYDDVPPIPIRLSDLLVLAEGALKLKKYSNYKITVL